ncbi:MAG: hypothetical protein IPP77_05985 [Bacteroidetes bacterium]|nr:hypothetical protein [Bacteroidota bacterium]
MIHRITAPSHVQMTGSDSDAAAKDLFPSLAFILLKASLHPHRARMRPYTKKQIEELLYRQLEYIEELNERIQLLREQNVIYRAVNNKLTEEMLSKEPVKLYPVKSVNKHKD